MISLNEQFSLVFLFIGVTCCADVGLLTFVMPFPIDYRIFGLQCFLMADFFIYTMLGISGWLPIPIQVSTYYHIIIWILIMLWTTSIGTLSIWLYASLRYLGEKVFGYFDPEIYYSWEILAIKAGLTLAFVVTIIMIIANGMISYMLLEREIRNKVKISAGDTSARPIDDKPKDKREEKKDEKKEEKKDEKKDKK